MIPDSLPVLSVGHHEWGSGQACLMDAVSWLSGRPEWGDAPECVHPVLRFAAVRVNDLMPDEERYKLWSLVPRLIGTNIDLPQDEAKRLKVRLAVFSARYVLPLVDERYEQAAVKAIEAAEGWLCGDVSEEGCLAAAAATAATAATAVNAAAYAAAATYAAYAVNAAYAAYAVNAATYAAAYAANAANATTVATVAANASADAAPFDFLVALVDEFHRLTNVPERAVTDAEWGELREALGVS